MPSLHDQIDIACAGEPHAEFEGEEIEYTPSGESALEFNAPVMRDPNGPIAEGQGVRIPLIVLVPKSLVPTVVVGADQVRLMARADSAGTHVRKVKAIMAQDGAFWTLKL